MKKVYILLYILVHISCNQDSTLETQEIAPKLPVISIYTDDALPVDSRNTYRKGTLELSSDDEDLFLDIKIRGRGNFTWKNSPKKPFQIKFENSQSVLGMPGDERWILLANYFDKTMLRNEVAFNLSRYSNLDWTPESRFVELFLNSEYQGVYQITQKVENTYNRVNVGAGGYLLEADQLSRLSPDDVYFTSNNQVFNIKSPSLNYDDNEYKVIEDYIDLTVNILMGNNFKSPSDGYSKYIDVDSFVDWYLINEITKNNDAVFYSSVYLTYIPGGKLKMGAVWDFDTSLGNIRLNGNEAANGFWVKNAPWYSRLFEDPNFVEKVKLRFDDFYRNKEFFRNQIDLNSLLLSNPQKQNFQKWPILGSKIWPNYVAFPTYNEEVTYLKEWLDERFEWLKINLNDL